MKKRITKKEFYAMGGLQKTGLFRKHNGRHWEYYKEV